MSGKTWLSGILGPRCDPAQGTSTVEWRIVDGLDSYPHPSTPAALKVIIPERLLSSETFVGFDDRPHHDRATSLFAVAPPRFGST